MILCLTAHSPGRTHARIHGQTTRKHSQTPIDGRRHKNALSYVGLKAGMKSDEEWGLASHGQDPLFHSGAVDVVILNYHVLLEYFHRVQLVSALPLRQSHLPPKRQTELTPRTQPQISRQ